ncbi:STAS domain-containing protein [Aliiglaciecola sp. 2_MG-2023]|uniref:STAS domain-containing protein n=1 Tax=unclassified Aliiglaciecola TaxID=2593648 RepID=UPI0026E20DD2|nr:MULTISPECIES: STAS domain-containing protein [unclassified Aliiglaciecola]MDO6709442.1 STAS domain-containing protein [Aliiglaciecola sp. 2_MG-2023]MDO6750590.1 STAS domain-containing protein [Aliiglaciecola sp. 1_MG-2023]
MSLETRPGDGGKELIIYMEEKFDFGKVQEFRDAYLSASNDVETIIVDLSNTEYLDSSALGMLLNMQKAMEDKVTTFKIANSRPQVAKILKISRFDKKFDMT